MTNNYKEIENFIFKVLETRSTFAERGDSNYDFESTNDGAKYLHLVRVSTYIGAFSAFYMLDELKKVMQQKGVERGILWLWTTRNEEIEKICRERYAEITILFLEDVFFAIKDDLKLKSDFLALTKIVISNDVIEPKPFVASLQRPAIESIQNISNRLKQELEAVQAGRTYAYAYEKKCEEILNFLFAENLYCWKSQNPAENGNRFDLLCKIKKTDSNIVWKFIAEELKSRYVLFEFKNYSDEINEMQIITTERYLFGTGFRKLGFIISRNEVSNEKLKSICYGITRESGKVLIFLSDNDLKEMLDCKGMEMDPSEILENKIDEYFMGISR